MYNLKLILILICITSCSPQKKLQRLVKKNPELIRVDTIHHYDTIQHVTEKVHLDTVMSHFSHFKDTLIINKDNLTVKTFYNYTTDSIYIFGECKEDTLYIPYEVKIPIETIVVEEKKTPLSFWIICTLVVIAFKLLLMYKTK